MTTEQNKAKAWVLAPMEPTPEIIAAAAIAVWPLASEADIELARQAAPIVLMQMDLGPDFTVETLAAALATMAPAYRAMLAAAPKVEPAEQATKWQEPHPPSRHCMCPSCIPSFDDRFAAQQAPAQPAGAWRCFHCDASFTDSDDAQEHFGRSEYSQPACQIDAKEYRAMEERMRRYNDEDSDLHRVMYGMQSDHQIALKREEEKGYARGLADAKKHPEDLGLIAAPAQPPAKVEREALTGWQDIETAPKDGTRVILAWGGKSINGFYLNNSATSHPWQGWRVESLVPRPAGAPTAWMPFPEIAGTPPVAWPRRWINADDQKPPMNTEVLIAFRDSSLPATGQYTASPHDTWGSSFPAENDPDDTGPITHWMPLPPAPTVAEKENGK